METIKKYIPFINSIFLILILAQWLGKANLKSDFHDYYTASNLFSEKKDIYQKDTLKDLRENIKPQDFFNPDNLRKIEALKGKLASYIYPPLFAFILIPIASLDYEIASVLFVILNFICLCFSLYLFKEMFPIANFASVLFLTLFSSYRFLESHGNNNQVALILLLLTLLSIRSEKDWLSALLLSLATVIKLTPAIFILYFLFEKRYKVLFFFMGFMIIWIILPGLFLGMEYNLLQWQNWKELVLDNAMKNPVFRAWKNNQSLVATLAKYFLLVDDPDSQTKYNLPFFIINPITLKIINYSLSLSIIVPLFIRLKNGLNKNSFIAALFILSAVFSGISWIHSFVILLYPMYYLFARFSFVSNSKEKTLSYIFYFIVFIIFISSGFISRDLENIFLMYSGFLYISIGLYTILLLLPEKKIV